MTISRKIDSFIEKSSWIRKMFEEGARLRKIHGDASVFDLSLGNPNLPPPPEFQKALTDVVAGLKTGDHGYMPNNGYLETRRAVADCLNAEQGLALAPGDILMTCGAAGALNAAFKALLDPGDEVIVPAPYFVEYNFHVDNHGGVLRPVSTREDFELDLAAIAAAIGPKTKVMLINSPNNPTGQIYAAATLERLGRLLADRGRDLNRTIYLVSDEPYRKLVYDDHTVPSLLAIYPDSLVASSFSKDLSIPGERLGYIALNPRATHHDLLVDALHMTNRILGFVNAPALMQRVAARALNSSVDVGAYARKRELMCDVLAGCGYVFERPKGAFYIFPKAPVADDVAFVQTLQDELIIAVPGSGFGGPGHFRVAFCVDDATITGSRPAFERAMARCRQMNP